MEGYYDILLKFIFLIGLDLKNSKIKLRVVITLAAVVSTILQGLVFFLNEKNALIDRFNSVPCFVFPAEGFVKMIVALYHHIQIKKVMESLDLIYFNMEAIDREKVKATAFSLRKIVQIYSFACIFIVVIYNLSPCIIMAQVKLSTGEWIFLYPYFFWWPFEPLDYYFFTYLYEAVIGCISANVVVTADLLFLLMLVQLVSHFRHLHGSFHDLIVEISETKELGRKQRDKFKVLVDIQSELNEKCDEMNEIFQFSVMIHFIITSIVICFSSFVLVTMTDPMVQIKFWSVILTTLMHTFILCWLGDMVHEEVKYIWIIFKNIS